MSMRPYLRDHRLDGLPEPLLYVLTSQCGLCGYRGTLLWRCPVRQKSLCNECAADLIREEMRDG